MPASPARAADPDTPIGATDRDVLRRLGAEVRALRDGAGLSGRALADRLSWSQTKVSRIETGLVRPTVADVDSLLAALAAPPETVERVQTLAEQAQHVSVSWKNVHRGGLAARQQELADLEREAAEIQHFQPAVVPGLLQTPEYARQVLELANISRQLDLDAAVSARLRRQDVLFQPDGPTHRFVLTEAALRWRPGSWLVLRTQLDRVISMATLPNVDLRVLPWTTQAPAIAGHSFRVFMHRDGQSTPIVLVETVSAETTVYGEEEVGLYRDTYQRLANASLESDESIAYMQQMVESLPTDGYDVPTSTDT